MKEEESKYIHIETEEREMPDGTVRFVKKKVGNKIPDAVYNHTSEKNISLTDIVNELKQFAELYDIPIITPEYYTDYYEHGEKEIANNIMGCSTGGEGFKPGFLVCFNRRLKGPLCSQCIDKNVCNNKQYIKIIKQRNTK